MLDVKQCDLLLNLLDGQPFKGRDMAAEIIAIGKEIEEIKATAAKTEEK
jgi:hypothetical protein